MAFQSRNAHLLLTSIFLPKSSQSSSSTRSFFSNRVVQSETTRVCANFFTTRPPLQQTSKTISLLQTRSFQSIHKLNTPKRKIPSSPQRYVPPKKYTPPQRNPDPNETEYEPEPAAVNQELYRKAEAKQFYGKIATGFLIAASVTVFAWKAHALPAPAFIKNIDGFLSRNFVLSQYNLEMGRWWTYITYTFNHGGIFHLAFNMWAMWSFASITGALLGGKGVLLFYVAGGLAGGIASIWLPQDKGGFFRGHVGASGSVLALITGMAVITPQMPIGVVLLPGSVPAWVFTLMFAAYSVFAHENGLEKGTGHLGHLGGMAAGAVLGAIFKVRMGRGLL